MTVKHNMLSLSCAQPVDKKGKTRWHAAYHRPAQNALFFELNLQSQFFF